MARVIGKTKAIVLRTRRMGETSKLVTLYTEEFGKISVTAKGARRPKSKFGAGLEVMTEIQAVCYVRDDRDLHTLSDCEVLRTFPQLLNDIQRMAYGSGACEMVDRLTIDGEPAERLYRCLIGVLAGFEEVESAQIEPLFWYYQLRVADALGYRPELSCCVSCGAGLASGGGGGEWHQFSPALGGAICAPCSRQTTPYEEAGQAVVGMRGRAISLDCGRRFFVRERRRCRTDVPRGGDQRAISRRAATAEDLPSGGDPANPPEKRRDPRHAAPNSRVPRRPERSPPVTRFSRPGGGARINDASTADTVETI